MWARPQSRVASQTSTQRCLLQSIGPKALVNSRKQEPLANGRRWVYVTLERPVRQHPSDVRKDHPMRKLLVSGLALALLVGGASTLMAAEKNWTESKGKLPFIIGYEKGMAEAKFSGRPMMVFFTTTW